MRRSLTLLACLLLALPTMAQPVARALNKPNLTILTDEGLLLPLARIARAYAIESQTPLTIVVKSTADAERQIEQGLEAHVILTADYPLIARLTEQGMTDVTSRRKLARTGLALVTVNALGQQAKLATRISFASILAATPQLLVFSNDPATREGALVTKLIALPEFAEMLVTRLTFKPSHDDVLAALRDGPSLAFMLAADAVAEPDVRIVSLLPEGLSAPVTFDMVVLGSESMADARRFTNFLQARKAQAIFANFGYQPPAK